MSVSVADDWLALELDRVWLRADACLRHLCAAGLRAQPHGDLAAVLAARGRRPLDEFAGALERADADVLAARGASPILRLGLTRLESEVLVLAIAPHVDPALVEMFAAVRGARRAVDLGLVIQLHQLAREDRAALLGVLDPALPLLASRLIEIAPLEPGAASATSRGIFPTFTALELLAGRPASQRPSVLAHYAD